MKLEAVLSIDVPPKSVFVSWVNSYSGVVIRTHHTTLLFDPVMMRVDGTIAIDAIVITHEHIDHFDPETVYELQKKTNAAVLATPFVTKRIRIVSSGKIKPLKIGDSAWIRDIALYTAYSFHPGHDPLSFFIKAHGITMFHPSDSDAYPGMKQLGETFRPELMLYFGTSFENGVRIAKLIRPKIVLVYDVRPYLLIRQFKEALSHELPGGRLETMKQFEVYHLERDATGEVCCKKFLSLP